MSTIKRGLLPVGAVAACCCLAACGSSASTSTSTSGSSASSGSTVARRPSSADRAAFVACLKKHGVTIPSRPPGQAGGYGSGGAAGSSGAPRSGGGDGSGGARPPFGGGHGFFSNPKLRAAFQACGRGRLGPGRFRAPTNNPAFQAALTKYVTCVRQHGYDLPKPNLSGTGPIFPSSIRSSSKFQAASKACQSLLARPSGRPFGSAPPKA